MGASIGHDHAAGQGDLALTTFKRDALCELNWALADVSAAAVKFLDAEGAEFEKDQSPVSVRGFVDEMMIDEGTLVSMLHYKNSAGQTAVRLCIRDLETKIEYDFMHNPDGILPKDLLEFNEIRSAGNYAVKKSGNVVVAASGIGDPIGTSELEQAARYFAKLLQTMTPKSQAAPVPELDALTFREQL
jgi:hypothetical protein